jgi:hypothetical protein
MGDPSDLISRLLADAGLADAVERVGDGMFRLKWGSATIICVASGDGVVAVAPIFEKPPEKNQLAFFRRLLELNAEIGGTAAFSVHKNGTVALQCGRTLQGLDAHELKIMLATVGKFADDYDDKLRDEFYAR